MTFLPSATLLSPPPPPPHQCHFLFILYFFLLLLFDYSQSKRQWIWSAFTVKSLLVYNRPHSIKRINNEEAKQSEREGQREREIDIDSMKMCEKQTLAGICHASRQIYTFGPYIQSSYVFPTPSAGIFVVVVVVIASLRLHIFLTEYILLRQLRSTFFLFHLCWCSRPAFN